MKLKEVECKPETPTNPALRAPVKLNPNVN
jgi:hypothetical protein